MPRTTQEEEAKMYDRKGKKELLKEIRKSLVKYLKEKG